jgi:hypothetical protein
MGIAWWLLPALFLTVGLFVLSVFDVMVVVSKKVAINDRLESARLAFAVLFFASLLVAIAWTTAVGDCNTIYYCHIACAATFTFMGISRIFALLSKHNPLFYIDLALCAAAAIISVVQLLP